MDYDLIAKLATGEVPTDEDIANMLSEICENEHANCSSSDCPILKLNGGEAPGSDKPFRENRGCDCFKNGTAMLEFIRENSGSVEGRQRAILKKEFKGIQNVNFVIDALESKTDGDIEYLMNRLVSKFDILEKGEATNRKTNIVLIASLANYLVFKSTSMHALRIVLHQHYSFDWTV